MRCEHCNEREATTHIKKIINGNKTELHLCSECAAELGVAEEFSPENFFADTFFGNLLGAGIPAMNVLSGVERCESCGSSFNDIVKNGSDVRTVMRNLKISLSRPSLKFMAKQSMLAKMLLIRLMKPKRPKHLRIWQKSLKKS